MCMRGGVGRVWDKDEELRRVKRGQEVECEATLIGWVLRGTGRYHDGSGRCVPLVDGAHYKGVGHPIGNAGVAINGTPSSLATTSGQRSYDCEHSLCAVLLQWVQLRCANPQ
ncbi:UNVERIFIED_CONTAM: hypothetical protein HHA_455730 [Hammondia hammondi]|eukprot:XP_008888894.1 hypothetical protein HHA_455730 [Hammondia hammondi]